MKVFGFFSTGLSIDKDRDLNLKQMRELSDSRTIPACRLGDRVPAPHVVSHSHAFLPGFGNKDSLELMKSLSRLSAFA